MQTTKNFGLRKPESTDFYNIEDMNYNADVLDEKLKQIEESADPSTAQNHISNKSNPHGVTKEQVGLGNVPNVGTNDQTPTYTVPSAAAELTSGEKLSVAFGKIAKAVSTIINHIADGVSHVTASERSKWNAKLDSTGKAADSDKLDGHDSEYFASNDSVNELGHRFVIVPTVEDMNTLPVYRAGIVYNDAKNAPPQMKEFSIGYGLFYTIGYNDAYQIQKVVLGNGVILERSCNQGNFSSWKQNATITDLGNYLPLNGGDINGSVALIDKLGSNTRALLTQNSIVGASIGVWDNGTIGMHDNTGADWIFYKGLGGTPVFKGTADSANSVNVYGGNEVNFKGFTNGTGLFFNYRDGSTNQANTKALDWFRFGSGLANGTDAVQIDMTKGAGTLRDILHTGNMADHVLPKTGGRLTRHDNVIMELESTYQNFPLIGFYGTGGQLGNLGFNGVGNPCYAENNGTVRTLHHDGNSAKVHIGTSAPSDTSALWVY